MPQGMAAPLALLDAVETRLRIPSTQEFAQGIAAILQSDGPMTEISKNKKGVEKERDLRPMLLPGATVSYEAGFTSLTLKTRAGSRNHLNLDHLVQSFGEQVEGLAKGRFIHLKRLEMFTLKDDCFISLGEI